LNAGFVAKLSPAGDKLLASTFLGGGYSTQANSVVVDASGNALITGFTQGFTTGATPGAYQTKLVDTCTPSLVIHGPPYTGSGDAFVLKLNGTFSNAGFLTYLGGSCNDGGNSIALDPSGNIWVAGSTSSPDFPLKDPFQVTGLVSSTAGFVSELNGDGSQLLFSSLSEGSVLALAPGSVFLAGSSGPSASVVRIDPAKSAAVGINSVVPVVNFPPTTTSPAFVGIAPGQLIQIKGHNLGPTSKASAQLDASGRLPFILGNTIVFFDNVPAALLSVEATSITCFVPFEVNATTKITVRSDGQLSNAVKAGLFSSAPQVLTITNQDGSMNSADHPAKAGSAIALYVTGLGETNPPGADGLLNAAPLPVPLVGISVYFDGSQTPATVEFVGAAPGMIAGISQVNVRVPAGGSTPGGLSVNGSRATLYVVP